MFAAEIDIGQWPRDKREVTPYAGWNVHRYERTKHVIVLHILEKVSLVTQVRGKGGKEVVRQSYALRRGRIIRHSRA